MVSIKPGINTASFALSSCIYLVIAIAFTAGCKSTNHRQTTSGMLSGSELIDFQNYFGTEDDLSSADNLKPDQHYQAQEHVSGLGLTAGGLSSASTSKLLASWQYFRATLEDARLNIAKSTKADKKYWNHIISQLSAAKFENIVGVGATGGSGQPKAVCARGNVAAFVIDFRKPVYVCGKFLAKKEYSAKFFGQSIMHELSHALLDAGECFATRVAAGLMMAAKQDYSKNPYWQRCRLDRWLAGKEVLGVGFYQSFDTAGLQCQFKTAAKNAQPVDWTVSAVTIESEKSDWAVKTKGGYRMDASQNITFRLSLHRTLWPDPTKSYNLTVASLGNELETAIANKSLNSNYLAKFIPYLSQKQEKPDSTWRINKCWVKK
jgi:hypothetical protein